MLHFSMSSWALSNFTENQLYIRPGNYRRSLGEKSSLRSGASAELCQLGFRQMHSIPHSRGFYCLASSQVTSIVFCGLASPNMHIVRCTVGLASLNMHIVGCTLWSSISHHAYRRMHALDWHISSCMLKMHALDCHLSSCMS